MIGRHLRIFIDGLSELMGRIGWVIVLYCMIFGVTDVFMRYVLNAPSMWIGTSMQAAMVLLACAGGVFALKHDAFVKLDLFYADAKPRTKAILDVMTAPFTFLFLGVLIWKGYDAAMFSLMLNQTTPTAVPIPIYPIKFAIPFTGVIVAMLVIKRFLIDLRTVFGGQADEAA
ncbi:TRAP transporter small permease subunit [Roseovarius salis]|uniref:TRAP transporter small permease subunit n=1 Tax=Roseovarius salis TaxID=3376063 RepID=UPI0037C51465